MSRWGIRSPALLLGFAIAVACQQAPPEVEAVRCGSDPAVEAQINEIMDGHVAAHYAQDAVAAAGDYAEDVWFIGDDGMELRTRDAMVSLYEQMYQATRLVDFTYSPEEVVVCADAAHAVGHYTETIETDGQQSTIRYNYMLFWRLQPDGTWKVSRGTFVAVPPTA